MIKQMIPVLAPILTVKAPAAMHCARAIMDFVMLAMYSSHDEHTLSYMCVTLDRVDKLKRVFAKSRPINPESGEHHFNIPKFHVMTHYASFIRLYGSAQGFDTCYGEAAHKFLIKDFFYRTNKNEGWESQILLHNIRRQNIRAMEDVLLFTESKTKSQPDIDLEVQTIKSTRDPLDLTILNIPCDIDTLAEMKLYKLKSSCWRQVGSVNDALNLSDFIDALAVFVRESRCKIDGNIDDEQTMDCRESDPSWILTYCMSIHSSIICWERDGKNNQHVDRLVERHAICAPAWRGRIGN